MTTQYRSFISEISKLQELPSTRVNVWVKNPPKWLPEGECLYLLTSNFSADTLKTTYYYPGKIQFFVYPSTYEILYIKYVFESDKKCTIL